jgi:hypothetical protein
MIILGIMLNIVGFVFMVVYLIPVLSPDLNAQPRFQYAQLGLGIFLSGFVVDIIGFRHKK